MTFARTSTLAIAAASILSFSPSAEAACYTHVDAMAQQLRRDTRALRREIRIHMRHAAHYEHLSRDAYDMYRGASHIQQLARHRGSLTHMAHDLNRLDRLYHHIEGLLTHIVRDAQRCNGHIDGNFGHVVAVMNRVSATLHHLRGEVQELRRVRHTVHRPFGHGSRYDFVRHYDDGPSIGYGGRKGGVSYNNGRLGFHFSF